MRNDVPYQKNNRTNIPEYISKEIFAEYNVELRGDTSQTTNYNCPASEQNRPRTRPTHEMTLVDCCDRRSVRLNVVGRIKPVCSWVSLAKKDTEHESNDAKNSNWCSMNTIRKGLVWRLGIRNRTTSRDHPNYSIIMISPDTEKSSGNLSGFAVIQRLQLKTSVNAGVKNLPEMIICTQFYSFAYYC